ncbi:MAG: hypothetical protein ACPG4X_16865 [Pikeienuella sp.]
MFATRKRIASTATKTWPTPVRGWVASGNIVYGREDSAEVLDNYFPTTQGARLRSGTAKHATLGAAGNRFMTYEVATGSKLFGCTASDILEVSSPADEDVAPTASMTGLTGGDWSSVQFTTTGGAFMVGVNGTDHAVYYDGTTLDPLVNEEVFNLAYDALTVAFTVGQTITGGTSGATAELLAVTPSSTTAGTLKVGAITGTFQDNETLTDAGSGSATSNIPSGTSSSSSVTITGVDTDALSVIWMHQERIWFVEKNTLNAWYLPVDSIGGAANRLVLGSVFKKGGSLVFGATWSLDSGSGLDDKCVFVTDQGEVAVYEGTNPASASTWGLVGVYQISPPLNKHAHVSVGGDLIIATKDGLVPVSQAISRDRASLKAEAMSYNIEDAWLDAIAGSTSSDTVSVTLWQSQGQLLVGTPAQYLGQDVSFVANARTGAWGRYLGWDVGTSVVFEDQLYFADSSGSVFKAEIGGNDNGTAYTGYYIPKFSECGTDGLKHVNHVAFLVRSPVPVNYGVKVFTDYTIGEIPTVSPIAESSGSVWGGITWGGGGTWGGGSTKTGQKKWKTARGQGYSIAPAVSVTVNQTGKPEVEIMSLQARYEVGLPL